jgi:hypothetical protein
MSLAMIMVLDLFPGLKRLLFGNCLQNARPRMEMGWECLPQFQQGSHG